MASIIREKAVLSEFFEKFRPKNLRFSGTLSEFVIHEFGNTTDFRQVLNGLVIFEQHQFRASI